MIGQLLTGRYLILEKLGTGGFSETYLARDKYLPQHPLCVVKCLKLPSTAKISPETAQRLFETEARVMERLGRHHSQIPRLLAYCHEQSQVYLVQDYIDGENLAKWVARGQRLSTKSAIALLFDVLHVLEYLHSHRVIHRDVKPSNVIRRRRDGKMILIDFGAACIMSTSESEGKPDSDSASLSIGTPGYMPDEQHLGMAQFNSDLYALGVLVIYLLTGVKPTQFQPDLVSGELNWKHHLPQKPIQPELVAILERMVRTKHRDRYQEAADVLNDLQALTPAHRLNRPQTITRSRKVLQQVGISMLVSVLLGGGGGYVYAHSQRAESLLDRIGQRLNPAPIHLTPLQSASLSSPVKHMIIAPNDRRLITASHDHQLRFWSLPEGTLINTVSGHTDTTAIALTPDSKLLLTGGSDGLVRVWDADSGQFIRALRGHQSAVVSLALSPDSQTIVSADQNGTLQQWQIQSGANLQTLKMTQSTVTALTYSTTGDRIITANANRQIHVWNLQTGQLQRTFTGHTDQITSLQMVDPDTLMSAGGDRTLLWNLNREELTTVVSNNAVPPVAMVTHHRRAIALYENGSLHFWQPNASQTISTAASPLKTSQAAALSPNLSYVANWNANQLKIWQISAKN
jgi:serine/threonine protein kinase